MEKLLQVSGLETQFTKDKEKLKILRGVSFHINKGEVLGLVGNPAAAKSNLLSIMKLFKGTSGEISGEAFPSKAKILLINQRGK